MSDETESQPSERRPARRSKVGRVARKYDLSGMGAALERRWIGEQGERQSLRDLADYFNRRVLEAAIDEANGKTIDGEIENLYRLLIDDDVSASANAQAETKLARMGVDVESVRQDFVSHQAIHTYLTKFKDIEPPGSRDASVDPVEKRAETIQRLRNRLVAVAEHGLESLKNADHLSLGSFDVLVGVTVYCDECGASYDHMDLLARGGCECRLRSD